MRPLPEAPLPRFEELLRARWSAGRWYLRRGALACSFGLLGLRWCEVATIGPGDFTCGSPDRLFVRTGKRGRPRTIEVPDGLRAAALAMRAAVAGGDPEAVFVVASGRRMNYHDIRRYVSTVTREVFGQAFSFHCFRHTAAVRVYRRTRDVLAVSRFLGHRSLQWTQSYLCSLEVVDVGGPAAFQGTSGLRVVSADSDAAEEVAASSVRVGQTRAEISRAVIQDALRAIERASPATDAASAAAGRPSIAAAGPATAAVSVAVGRLAVVRAIEPGSLDSRRNVASAAGATEGEQAGAAALFLVGGCALHPAAALRPWRVPCVDGSHDALACSVCGRFIRFV